MFVCLGKHLLGTECILGVVFRPIPADKAQLGRAPMSVRYLGKSMVKTCALPPPWGGREVFQEGTSGSVFESSSGEEVWEPVPAQDQRPVCM